MKISIVSNYLPIRCGIATFTGNLYQAIKQAIDSHNQHVEENSLNPDDLESNKVELNIKAFCEQPEDFPAEVAEQFEKENYEHYTEAANRINNNGSKVCLLQHEFGIFGGEEGVFLLPFLSQLKIPLIITMHTVLIEPNYIQKFIIEEMIKKANRIVVMSMKAIKILVENYDINREKIILIEHGIPTLSVKQSKDYYRKHLSLTHKNILLTFGLLSKNKGLEVVIKALPKIIKRHPDTLYIIAGQTHPNVVKYFGEEYRDYLLELTKKLGVEKNILFVNKFLSQNELLEYLYASDIFITPYQREDQITSGALTYAIGAGCIPISTRYWHAQDIINENRGILFNFNDHQNLSDELNQLLDNPDRVVTMQQNARMYGKDITWNKIGQKYLDLIQFLNRFNPAIISPGYDSKPKLTKADLLKTVKLPELDLQHIHRLTDNTGMIQHAKYCIPNLHEGYCVDDNARALLLMTMLYRLNPKQEYITYMYTYLKFLYYMKLEDGNFRNFLSFSREYLDEKGTEDSFGRTIWALGYLIKFPPNDSIFQIASKIFQEALSHINDLKYIRGKANVMIGLSYYNDVFNDENIKLMISKIGTEMIEQFNQNSDYKKDWYWFENQLTYDNALLPLALIKGYENTQREDFLSVSQKAYDFLSDNAISEEYFSPIGNTNWWKKGESKFPFDQQPVEAMSMVLLAQKHYTITKQNIHLNHMLKSFNWFLGENILRLPLYDSETKGCCDGLTATGLNRNQGAESTLAYFISHVSVELLLSKNRQNN